MMGRSKFGPAYRGRCVHPGPPFGSRKKMQDTARCVRGRGGVIALTYETHWKGQIAPSWEREIDSQHSRKQILLYRSGTPDQRRKSAAESELARVKGLRAASPGYDFVSRDVWARCFRNSVLPVGAHFATRLKTPSDVFIVRFLDDPGPVKITPLPGQIFYCCRRCLWVLVSPNSPWYCSSFMHGY